MYFVLPLPDSDNLGRHLFIDFNGASKRISFELRDNNKTTVLMYFNADGGSLFS